MSNCGRSPTSGHDHRWAVEGCHGAGRSLAQRLVGDGEIGVRRAGQARRPGAGLLAGTRPQDRLDDAVSVGTAALLGDGIARVHCDDALVSLRLLSDRRAELIALRTQAVCRFTVCSSSSPRRSGAQARRRESPSSTGETAPRLRRSTSFASS